MNTNKHWTNFIWQPALAICFVLIVLYVMNRFSDSSVLWAVGASSLSSSCYLVFGTPSASSSHSKKLFWAYIIGIVTGLCFRFISEYAETLFGTKILHDSYHTDAIFAAISIGICFVLMSLFKKEHPPAAGIALVLVLDSHDVAEIFVILVAVTVLSLLRYLLQHKLVDL